MASLDEPDDVARAWHGPFARRFFVGVAAFYFACIWLDAAGSDLYWSLVPSTITYFTQVAALFPNAAVAIIEYRVEGWDCAEKRWTEIDPRPDFPMNADNKENRFDRTLHFFRQNRVVMRALDEFLVERHDARAREGEEPVGSIGGIRTMSIRVPLPSPGEKIEPYARLPADAYPASERHYFYFTPTSRREARCGGSVPSGGE
jgi:hypothetical protein